MTARPGRDAGFTLIEVLIALVLAGLVVSAALGLPELFARIDQQSQKAAELRDGVAGRAPLCWPLHHPASAGSWFCISSF
jgi:prepilin-type N-terminal cleavage/methylation domain-containing protein